MFHRFRNFEIPGLRPPQDISIFEQDPQPGHESGLVINRSADDTRKDDTQEANGHDWAKHSEPQIQKNIKFLSDVGSCLSIFRDVGGKNRQKQKIHQHPPK